MSKMINRSVNVPFHHIDDTLGNVLDTITNLVAKYGSDAWLEVSGGGEGDDIEFTVTYQSPETDEDREKQAKKLALQKEQDLQVIENLKRKHNLP